MIRKWLKQRRDRGITEKLEAIDDLLKLLAKSTDSSYSGLSVAELVERVESTRKKLKGGDSKANKALWSLFVPTGPLQETAIDNGWGDEFLIIASKLA
ncbi:MAG: hypothetical protein HKN35_06215 [Woeseia sp.]|nr:hypothetical protein [Woeseia sp.]MBU2678523.1 hypothetical protein [Gammaproteobacteria bacterium]NNE60466.1 hypothetical protein [Woeseia sp.]NNL52258.1 hypothetical protein [Woeseiaceae bacterium]